MIPKAFTAINAGDIQAMIEGGMQEGRTIDFKQTLPGPKESDTKEFLAAPRLKPLGAGRYGAFADLPFDSPGVHCR